jgi:uncharacterized protein
MLWKVVFHIDELAKWDLLLGNINNFLGRLEDDESSIRVVINAAAVLGVTKSEYIETIKKLKHKNVQFECCKIALAGNLLDEKNLSDEVQIIPSGIKRLVELQGKGYAYIKP